MASRNLLKREYVQLAHVYDPKKHSPAGWFASEKLDGMRAFWDGGASRGKPASQVPYANTEKDHIRVNEVIATGLWSRYGNVIYAPDWFLDQLPNFCLDGELWSGRGNFQTNQATVKDHNPGSGWRNVRYMVFDMPWPYSLFQDGDISVQAYKVFLRGCYPWWQANFTGIMPPLSSYEEVHNYLCSNLKITENLQVHTQWRMPFSTPAAVTELNRLLDSVVDQGGEGIMLRKPSASWEPKRSYNILKVKDFNDAEAIVTGYTTGRETDKGSKLLGKMGALITNFNGKRLELSGFTDAERELKGKNIVYAKEWAICNPEKEVPDWINNPLFPRGSQVTFRYRELTDDGIPKEARYHRKFQQ
jgi:DNA ligase-1